MSKTLLVTGASGHVGREVVRCALAAGYEVTAADRQPARQATPGVRHVRFDYAERSTWTPALEGQSRLFLMRPPAIADVETTLNPFVDAAAAAGVGMVAFLSVAGADCNRWVPHRAVEDHLRRGGMPHANLRPGFFAQNLGDAYRRDIVEDGRLYVPAGRAPVHWVDVRDVAEAAVRVLDAPGEHDGRSHTLTGPGAVSWTAVAGLLGEAIGRPVRYVPASVPGYVLHLRRRGLPASAIAVQTVLHVLLRFGQGATVDPTLERMLGRPPRTVDEYIRDHAAIWTANREAAPSASHL